MGRWTHAVYPTKPTPSPVLAGLVLAGTIGPRHRVLDLGCGTGTDALGLCSWGVRKVTGIDVSARAVAIARRRAARRRPRPRFEVCDLVDVPRRFRRGAFDVVVDTLCANNLEAGQEEAYAEAVDWALAPRGAFVLQTRVAQTEYRARKGAWLEPWLAERFHLGRPVHVRLPESHGRTAPVAAYLARR